MSKHPMERKFQILKTLFKPAIPGIILLIISSPISSDIASKVCIISGLVLFIPFIIYLYVLVILHWKYRYRGNHSDLWGVLILIETSGFFKLIYMLRHILPDIFNKWRYVNDINN